VIPRRIESATDAGPRERCRGKSGMTINIEVSWNCLLLLGAGALVILRPARRTTVPESWNVAYKPLQHGPGIKRDHAAWG